MDEVRLLMGDVDVSNPHLSDAEIAYFITQGNQVSIRAAYLACLALIARYSQHISATIGRVATLNYAQLVKQFQDLADTLAREGGRPASLDVGPPVDVSSDVPAVIGETSWRNNRVW